MVNQNGSKAARPPKQKSIDAIKPPTVNGHASKPATSTTRASRGFLGRLFGFSARAVVWYTIVTVLFLCPPSLDKCTETTRTVCTAYFQLKHVAAPHIEPYYNTYAVPYLEKAQPYYETVDRTVLTPAWEYAEKYGAPAVHKVQALGQAQWDKNGQPMLAQIKKATQSKYDEKLAPHVDRVTERVGPYIEIARNNARQTYHDVLLPSYTFVQPYLLQGYAAASHFTANTVVPTAAWAWKKTCIFLDTTLWPRLRALYMETVEPQLVKIGKRLGRYNNTVAPKPESKTIASKATSSFTKPTVSSVYTPPAVVSSASSVVSSVVVAASSSISSVFKPAATPIHKFSDAADQVMAPEPDDDEEEKRRIARETVAEDLRAWQEKYTKAADEGAAEIQERIDEIAKEMVGQQIRVRGNGLLQLLQDSVVSELVTLRRRIIEIIGSVQKGSATQEQGQEQLLNAVRAAGLVIKKKAKDVRNWHETFDTDVRTMVTAAADSHFEILGSIKDLALQKIGMKWAWMDGVTYKDWAKYHLLKSRFLEWEQEMEKLVVSHPGLIECQNQGQAIEDRAMELATSAAKELGRLKQVAFWKLAALDDSNDFESDSTEAAYEESQRVKAQPQEQVTEKIIERDESEPAEFLVVNENLENFLENEAETETQASVASEVTAPGSEETIVELVSSLSSAFSSASDKIASIGDSSETPLPSADGFSAYIDKESTSETSTASEALASNEVIADVPIIVANASETTAPDTGDKPALAQIPVESEAKEPKAEPKVEEPKVEEPKTSEPKSEEPLKPQDDSEDDLDEPASPPSESIASVKPALFGAAAQSVPSRQPIMDDDTFESLKQRGIDLPATLSSVASSAYSVALSRASEQYESAVTMISGSMPKGTAQPIHVSLLASVSEAYAKAVASASAHLDEVIKSAESVYGAASKKVVPTPTPAPMVDWAAIEAIAAERLNQGRSWAEEQYSSAKVAIGLATPTPTSPVDALLQNAQHNYYAGMGLAQARYTQFMSAASSAFSSMTAAPTPTDLAGAVSSVAYVAGESASSVAHAAAQGAGDMYSAASDSAASIGSVVGENAAAVVDAAGSVVDAASSAVHTSWEVVVSQLSVQIYGAPTPTPWYEGLYSAAGEYAAMATDVASLGKENKAAEAAAHQYTVVSSIISELVVGRKPTFSESVFSRLDEVYKGASATAASIANGATAAVKSKVEQVKDEL